MDRAQVNPAQRLELRTAPELGVRFLSYALGRRRIRNPAAFAVARFRAAVADDLHRIRAELPEEETRSVEELVSALAFARSVPMPAAAIAAIEAELVAARARET